VSFITHLIKECPHLPLLVISLARPTYSERFPGWGSDQLEVVLPHGAPDYLPTAYTLDLAPLTREASQTLLTEILYSVGVLPVNVRDRILDSADGNPFYLEEYIQSLVDAGVIQLSQGEAGWTLNLERLGRLEMPATLVALLEARLDSLSPPQRVLIQQAAVIGRVFWRTALQAVHGDKPIADEDFKNLARRGFIIPQETSTFEGTEEYRFHHALLQNAAYQMLVKRSRQAYHAQVAAWTIAATQSTQRSGEFAPIIAGHYEAAGRNDQAADWYIQSGTLARKQGAPAQSRLFFERALSLLPLDVNDSTPAAELDRRWQALVGRDDVLGILGDTEGRIADDLALVDLAKLIGKDEQLAEAYYRQGYYLGVKGQYRQELETYQLGLNASRHVHDLRHETLILGLKVICEVRMGDMEAAAESARAALGCAEALGDQEVMARTLTNVSLYYTEKGDMARSARMLEQQLQISQETGNIEGQVIGLSNLGYTYILLGMPVEAIPVLQRCAQMASDNSIHSFFAYGLLNLGLAYLRGGDPVAALVELDKCLPDLKAMNDILDYGSGHTYKAMAREQGGEVNDALEIYRQAAAILKEIGTVGNMFDAEAGVARCFLTLSDHTAALEHVLPLHDYLKKNSGVRMEFPVLAYETCADIYAALGENSLARRAIGAGYGELLVRAGRISLPEWRNSFLDAVPEHRRIRLRWQEYMNSVQS
jgi:tetratricopeptide (TPR) repeat protein